MKKNFLIFSMITACMVGSCVSSSPAEAEPVRTSSAKKSSPLEVKDVKNVNTNADTAAIKLGSDSADPAKIQEEFQKEFARELAAAGPKAEGWALFSEAGMSYPGQRWIIRSNSQTKEVFSFCAIKQTEKKCSKKSISKKQFDHVAQTFAKADKLPHLLPTAFDGVNFEYLHARKGVPATIRVVFISSANPFPPEYEAIITAFNSLAENK